MKSPRPTALARTLRAFFSEHMPLTRGLSPHTLQSYRDALSSIGIPGCAS